MRRKTIVVTGGAGFIGSCLLWRLNHAGIDTILVVDELGTSDKWKNLRGKRFADYVEKDDFLPLLSAGKLGDIAAIFHLGACSTTTAADASYLIKNNYEYTKVLADWALGHMARFVYASSAATYGAGENGYDDAEGALAYLRPLNMYGYSKHLVDLWMLRHHLFDRAAGVKFFNVFGPNEYHKGEMMSVIGKQFETARQGRPIRLFKSYCNEYAAGEQRRDFIYVKDAVEALFFLYEHPAVNGIFNLGTGAAHSWNTIARALCAALGREPVIEYIDMPDAIRPTYQYFTEAKMEKFRRAGYTHCDMSLAGAVQDYVDYLRHHTYL